MRQTLNNLSVKAKTGFTIVKLIKTFGFRLLAFICGYFAATFYTFESIQLLLDQISRVKDLDKVLNIQDIIASKLASLLAIFFFITSCAMYYFWKNQDEIASINATLERIKFILKIPSSFLYICWCFLSGFSVYAYFHSGQVGVGIFAVGTILFAMPAFMFSFWLRDEFFKPIEKEWQRKAYPLVIGVFFIATGVCFLYSPIKFFLDLGDWYGFVATHFLES